MINIPIIQTVIIKHFQITHILFAPKRNRLGSYIELYMIKLYKKYSDYTITMPAKSALYHFTMHLRGCFYTDKTYSYPIYEHNIQRSSLLPLLPHSFAYFIAMIAVFNDCFNSSLFLGVKSIE